MEQWFYKECRSMLPNNSYLDTFHSLQTDKFDINSNQIAGRVIFTFLISYLFDRLILP